MCGRYTIIKSAEELEKQFEIDIDKTHYETSFNVAPGQKSIVVSQNLPNKAQFFMWGLHADWNTKGYALINTRKESILEKQSFQDLLYSQRCIIISDGFYEWKKSGNEKLPYYFYLQNKKAFAMAGLFSKSKAAQTEGTFSVITTTANTLMEPIHHRMPVIFHQSNQLKQWLNPNTPQQNLIYLMQPLSAKLMHKHAVSQLVNSNKNNNKNLISPIAEQGSLF